MIKNILLQQLEERNLLLSQAYISRIDLQTKTEYLSTTLIKLITGPRRAGKSVLALQLLQNQNFAYLNFDDDLLLKHFNEDTVTLTLKEIYQIFSFFCWTKFKTCPTGNSGLISCIAGD